MKKILLSTLVGAALLGSCSLKETNYSELDQNIVFSSAEGFDGLVNACYENIYYLYGKVDGIPLMEMGTDLWKIGSRNGNYGELTNYNEGLNSDVGVLKVVWNALYATVGYCNTAIYFSKQFPVETVAPKVAEARFLRAFANFHIVEQWGGVVLNTTCMAESGASTETAVRTSEEVFYDSIVSDLKYAVDNLPVKQSERGRVAKKAAYAMLAKVYMQRTRLYAKGSEQERKYADLAYETATKLIDATDMDCALYKSNGKQSGNAQVWDDNNNKSNQEFLFIECVDHTSGNNPEGWNRGRTDQYYMMKISSQAQNFGVVGDGLLYGRDNAAVWSPTAYLLTECFDPRLPKAETSEMLTSLAKDKLSRTPDTRFEDAFHYKYYGRYEDDWLLGGDNFQEFCDRYRKVYSALRRPSTKRTFPKNALLGAEFAVRYPDKNIYAASNHSNMLFEDTSNEECIACYTPNWQLDTVAANRNKCLALGPQEYINMNDSTGNNYGEEAEYSYFQNVFPSLKKHRAFKYVYSNQFNMMDQPIIRLTDIYLIAAEAAIVGSKGMQSGLKYLNEVRRHAALSSDAAEMDVASYDIEYILKERARELCGEQWRWYDLKRTRHLTQEYLTGKGRNPYITIFNSKFLVRPVPQQFLDQIANPGEFGNNGY